MKGKTGMLGRSHNRCAYTCTKPHGQGCLCACVCVFMCKLDQMTGEELWCKAIGTFLPSSGLCASCEERRTSQQSTATCILLLGLIRHVFLTSPDTWILQMLRNQQVVQAVYMRLVPKGGVQARGQESDAPAKRMGLCMPSC